MTGVVNFGLLAVLPWWLWLLMVLGAGFCWGAGTVLGGAFVRALGETFAGRTK